ncbi:L-idonate 5-dehydrogenase [Azospirillum halopraeferens]|uniref:L-idonate 5-dehydrogenase n=1 Tax=Azospirillum halopraeferens TaxID=34010 RepID=UPI00040EB94E|nr:L-idonate 5-dehydrogenase [Azospirillum halopraeferens]
MRAVVIHAPRDLRVEEMACGDPGPGEVRVRLGVGGICGSDLHYYQHGGFGAIRLREPMVLGHEVAGTVAAVGAGVAGVAPGDRVTVNPGVPCGDCVYCREGLRNQCLDMRFYGSAMRFPHVQGAFREEMVIAAEQAFAVGDAVTLEEAACAEPLSVCLHAVTRAGSLVGKRVLVSGCGPIGCLMVMAARFAGAQEIVACDVIPAPLALATRIGADAGVNVAEGAGLAGERRDKGRFDVTFECSGNPRALAEAVEVTRPRGTVVLVGLGGDVPLPMNAVVAKELHLHGTFRFDTEFARAAGLIARRRIDVRPVVTATLPLDRARDAFDLAADRSRSMKVQIILGT